MFSNSETSDAFEGDSEASVKTRPKYWTRRLILGVKGVGKHKGDIKK